MILSFKQQFINPILIGEKIHTLREDKTNRWKPGRKIDFFTGRYTSKDRVRFAPSNECVSTQKIFIDGAKRKVIVFRNGKRRRFLSEYEILVLSHNDGFKSVDDFFEWFNKDFDGKIIHWTDFKY